jgi:lipopolysaccharide/colanic/teichoic acid biosynthesis glycosyltransferase
MAWTREWLTSQWRETPGTGSAAVRLLDLAMAVAGLALSVPLIVLIVALIYLDTGRPILFSQIRLGRGGRRFRLYKFRKFHEKGRADGRPLTVGNDTRLTRVGKLLLRTKLDELPQLWNILKGEMSVVGPRPETPEFSDCFRDSYRKVLDYKPGIFGPSQVFFRNEGSLYPSDRDPERFYRDVLFPLKAQIDLDYFPHRTMMGDLAWIVRAMLAVFGSSSLPIEKLDGTERAEDIEARVHNLQRSRADGSAASASPFRPSPPSASRILPPKRIFGPNGSRKGRRRIVG